jgi:glutaredoxin 3
MTNESSGMEQTRLFTAKHLLKTKGIEYEEKNIAEGYKIQDLLELVPNAKTMPQIWLDEEHIGGYRELQEKLK